MRKIKKKLSIWLYVFYMSTFILMLSGLVFLLSSCTVEEIDTPKKPGSGKMVAVHFGLGGLKHNGSEVVTRNAASLPAPLRERGEKASFGGDGGDAETVVVPIGDGLAMVATLEVDQSVKTRTTTSGIPHYTIVRIVAYRDGDTHQHDALYWVHPDDVLVPYIDADFTVPEGQYTFVAYTYYNFSLDPMSFPVNHVETLPDINPDLDLIWGCYPDDGSTVTVDEHTTNNIVITTKHMFSGVKVILSTDQIGYVPITDIFNLSIGGKQADLIVKDGTFSPNTGAVKRTYSGLYTGIGTSEVSTSASDPVMVHTGNAQTTTLHIDSLFLDVPDGASIVNKRFFKLSAAFEKQLQGGVIYTLKVHFMKDEGITGDFRPQDYPNLIMYVGAFWKSNQTGERLITIKRPTTGTVNVIDGAWTAKVIVGSDWIVLDKQPSLDPGVGTNSPNRSGNDHDFDTMYPVNSTLRTVSGYLDQNTPQIYFRIGLTSTYEGPPDYPTRYGVILLTYANNARRHRIWIRQGHEADYLICNGAPVCTDPTHTQGLKVPRTVTRKFSPYNLTADTLNKQVITQALAANPASPGNRSRFTDYPTQAGAHFKWAYGHPNYMRIAHDPFSPDLPNLWYGVGLVTDPDPSPIGFWNTLQANNETCPPGYRRPNDGKIDGPENSMNIQFSELRQSLFEHPMTGLSYNEDLSNSSFGYYADGFFDRREIVMRTVIGGVVRPTSVAVNTRDIAHVGRIFYNAFTDFHHANASIFFPYGGTRYFTLNGALGTTIGGETSYWTSSRIDTPPQSNDPQSLKTRAHMLRFIDNGVSMHIEPEAARGDFGYLIRCVKDE